MIVFLQANIDNKKVYPYEIIYRLRPIMIEKTIKNEYTPSQCVKIMSIIARMKLYYFDRLYEALVKKLSKWENFRTLLDREKIMLLYYMAKSRQKNEALMEMILSNILGMTKKLTLLDFKILIIS